MKKNTAIRTDYILKVGKEGASRLSLLNEVHGSYSEALLRKFDILSNARVLELGCGTGQMAIWMARNLVPFGKVVALDVNAEQILIAKQAAKLQGVTNIEFECASIYELESGCEEFDLIYCRYLLLHLVEPLQALRSATNLLKTSGLMVCEEPTISTSFCYPYSEVYSKSRSLLKRLAEIKDLDFEIGMKLQLHFKSIGFETVDISFAQPILKNKNERRLLDMLFEECSDLYIQLNLSTFDEVKRIKENLKRLAEDNNSLIVFPRTTQIIARKVA